LAFTATSFIALFCFFAVRLSMGEESSGDIGSSPVFILPESSQLSESLKSVLVENSLVFDGVTDLVPRQDLVLVRERIDKMMLLDRNYRSELIPLHDVNEEVELGVLRLPHLEPTSFEFSDIPNYNSLAYEHSEVYVKVDLENQELRKRFHEEGIKLNLPKEKALVGKSFRYFIAVDGSGAVVQCLPTSVLGQAEDLDADLRGELRQLRFDKLEGVKLVRSVVKLDIQWGAKK